MNAPAEATLRVILAAQLGLPEAHFKPEQNLADDLGADSLDTAELLMALEDELDIEITLEEGEKVSTVGDLLALVERKVGAA